MKLSPAAAHFLTPQLSTILFAIKGLSAVALALTIAFYMQLERPFWAVVAAMMLQGRPQVGLVAEKSLLLIAATICGGLIGCLILESFLHHPALAIATLAVTTFIASYVGSAHRHVNYTYGCALVPVTASIVTLLAGADAPHLTSKAIFDILVSRLSEVSVGAVCATLCSALIVPSRLGSLHRLHAESLVQETIDCLASAFDVKTDLKEIRQRKRHLLVTISILLDESRAAKLESPGNYAGLIAHEALNLVIMIQAVIRYRLKHKILPLSLFDTIHVALAKQKYQPITTGQTRGLLKYVLLQNPLCPAALDQFKPPLIGDLLELVENIDKHLNAMLAACRNKHNGATPIKPRLSHDFTSNGLIALRSTVYIISSSSFWLMSGGTPSQVMMIIIPLLFAQLFSTVPNPSAVIRKLIMGALVAVPVGTLWAMNLLSFGTGNFEILLIIFLIPLFFALITMAYAPSAPGGIAFSFVYVLMVQPDNYMPFDFYTSLSLSLGVIAGLCILYVCVAIVPKPMAKHTQINALRHLARKASRLEQGVLDQAAFQSTAKGVMLHLARHSENHPRGDKSVGRAMQLFNKAMRKGNL